MSTRLGRPPGAIAITLALGLVAVVLGYWGYGEADASLDFPDTLYRSLQLLVLEYNGPPTDAPWQLEAARYLAAIVVAYALLSVLVIIARERADALRLRLLTNNHFVVIGLGTTGARVTSRLRSKRLPVAVVDSDLAATRAPGARSDGAIVVFGDARDPKILEKAEVGRASHILVSAGDDSTNLEILAACEERLNAPRASRTRVHVAIDDPFLWAQLHRRSIARDERSGRVEFVSFPDRIAMKLVDGGRESLAAPDVCRVLVWGAGPTAIRTAVHSVRRSLLSGRSPRLLLGGREVNGMRGELFSVDPWIAGMTVAPDGDPATAGFDVALVAGLREADALAAAARLTDASPSGTIVVQAPHDASARSLAKAGYDVGRIRLVAAEHEAFDPSLFTESALDVIARAKHEDYVAQEIARGASPVENPSIAPWDELPNNLKASNRFFAEGVGKKLSDLGAQLIPLASARPLERLALSDSQLEELARAEHDRWVCDLIDDGWQPTDGEKDPDLKLHPLLVPWESLNEDDREKDRAPIRALPEMLARIGYEVRMGDTALPLSG